MLALHFGKGIDRTLSWLFEDRTNENPPKPLYLEHELKGCAPSCCRPFCGSWPEACCFAGCCPGKGCLPGCFPCCSCGPDGRCCWGANACRHSCPTGGMVALEDELGKKIEEKSAAPPYQAFIDVRCPSDLTFENCSNHPCWLCNPGSRHAADLSPANQIRSVLLIRSDLISLNTLLI